MRLKWAKSAISIVPLWSWIVLPSTGVAQNIETHPVIIAMTSTQTHLAVTQPPARVEPTEQDKTVAENLTHQLDNYLKENDFKVEKLNVVQNGFSNYLAERRARRRGLSQNQLFSLILTGDFPKTFLPPQDWLESFGDVDRIDSRTPHVHLVERIGKIHKLPNVRKDKVKKGVRNIVYHLNLSGQMEYSHEFHDFSDFYFKRPSPLFSRSQIPEEYCRNVLSEVAAYRISMLFGFDTVTETRLMSEVVAENNTPYLGTARKTASPEGSTFQDQLPTDLLTNEKWRPALSRLRVVDYLLKAEDRHSANMLYDPINHDIRGIDYEESLMGLPGSSAHYPISGGLLPASYSDLASPRARDTIGERIMGVTYERLRDSLQDIATDEEIENIWLRIHILRADIQSH